MKNPYSQLFEQQKSHQFAVAQSSAKERIRKLESLRNAIEITHKQAIRDALYADFRKPTLETDFTEIYPVVDEIKFTCKQLKSWLKPERVQTPLSLIGSSSYIIAEPKGVCLIISPWNFPINLTFGPLVSAIAAGNTVILKPSEMTPHTSAVMAVIIRELFSEDEITLVEGEVETSEQLLRLPFNHIFFTGSPKVGKLVMKAASEHLTSVTLELGGKSPTIIDDSANMEQAIKRIIFGKFLNAGQTCIAPDYMFLKGSLKPQFIQLFKKTITDFYGTDISSSKSYSRVVNAKHFERLTGYLQDARQREIEIAFGGASDPATNFIEPTILFDPTDESEIMKNEIFGPLLPILTYEHIDEVISKINSNEKPLALYIFSNNKKTIQKIIQETRSGGVCVNHNLLQYLNHHLPFGGSNNSGIGKAHGRFGFLEFTNQKSLLRQGRLSASDLLRPPYTDFKQKLVDLTIKWF